MHTITMPAEGLVAAGVQDTRDPVMSAFFQRRREYDDLRHDVQDLEKALSDASNGTARYEATLSSRGCDGPGAEALRGLRRCKKQADPAAARRCTPTSIRREGLDHWRQRPQNQTIPSLRSSCSPS